MHMARSFLRDGADLRGQLFHERNGERSTAAFASERCGIELCRFADSGDDLGMGSRHQAVASGGACKRAFEARHGREQLFVGQEPGADLVREQEFETQG
jgi:hypothetical protein